MTNPKHPFAKEPELIWKVPAYLPYVQKPLTAALVKENEKAFGVKLPESYLHLLRAQNGGMMRYELPHGIIEKIAGLGSRPFSLSRNEISEEWGDVSFELKGLLALDGDGHWHICLDYRGGRTEPCVTHVDIETNSQSNVAPNFEDFLSQLIPTPPHAHHVVFGIEDLGALKATLEASFSAKFLLPRTQNGARMNTLRVETKAGRGSIWISSNLGPRGYCPKDSHWFKEVKDLMPGQGLQLPGAPADAYLIGASESCSSDLLKVLSKLGFKVFGMDSYIKAHWPGAS